MAGPRPRADLVLIGATELARLLGIRRSSLWDLRDSRRLPPPALHVGRVVRWRRTEIDARRLAPPAPGATARSTGSMMAARGTAGAPRIRSTPVGGRSTKRAAQPQRKRPRTTIAVGLPLMERIVAVGLELSVKEGRRLSHPAVLDLAVALLKKPTRRRSLR
jgi:predicted DNA-binding transcriptional regulator AlpA